MTVHYMWLCIAYSYALHKSLPDDIINLSIDASTKVIVGIVPAKTTSTKMQSTESESKNRNQRTEIKEPEAKNRNHRTGTTEPESQNRNHRNIRHMPCRHEGAHIQSAKAEGELIT